MKVQFTWDISSTVDLEATLKTLRSRGIKAGRCGGRPEKRGLDPDCQIRADYKGYGVLVSKAKMQVTGDYEKAIEMSRIIGSCVETHEESTDFNIVGVIIFRNNVAGDFLDSKVTKKVVETIKLGKQAYASFTRHVTKSGESLLGFQVIRNRDGSPVKSYFEESE